MVFYVQTDDKLSCSFNSRWLQVVFYIEADDKLSCSFNTHWFQKTEKRKKKKGGGGGGLWALLLDILIGN